MPSYRPVCIFSLLDINYFITSLLLMTSKVSGNIFTAASMALLFMNLVILYFDLWFLVCSMPVVKYYLDDCRLASSTN